MKPAVAVAAVVVAVALVAGLYVAFRPQPEASAGAAGADPVPENVKPGAALRMEFFLTVADGRLAAGPSVLQVVQGTEVTIRLRSDRADALHLHGYDLQTAVAPGQPATLTFTADKAGRFELELHEAHLELAALEVQPD